MLKRVQHDITLFITHNSQLTIKAIAFTLAETLIVMAVIGVVSALTLPNLNSSTGDKERVAKVKKIYQNLNDALGRAEAVYGPFDEWFVNDGNDDTKKTTRLAERMLEFMKVSKNCGMNTGCFSNLPLTYANGDIYENNYDASLSQCYRVILTDGISLGFQIGTHHNDTTKFNTRFRVDIDGPNKGQTRTGYDIFDFSIDSNTKQIIPSAFPDYWTGNVPNLNTTWGYHTAWVIKNDNMDYIKCRDLNWETKTTCK